MSSRSPRFACLRLLLLLVAVAAPGVVVEAAAEADAAPGAGVASTELRLARTYVTPAGTTVEKAKAAVLLSLDRRRWLVHLKDEPDRVIAFYARQPVMVALSVKLQPGRIEFWIRGQGPLEKLQKKEAQWLANLVGDVQGLLAPPASSGATTAPPHVG